MAQFIDSIKNVSKNYSKYDDWEQGQADKRAKKEYLAKTIDIPQDKVELTRQRAETVIRATEIMDARSEDNCQNMEQLTESITAFAALPLVFGVVPAQELATKKISKQISDLRTEQLKYDIDSVEYKNVQNKIKKLRKKSSSALKWITAGFTVITLAISMLMQLWGNHKQKEASRIGRYQARQNELKGLENFVVYTPEQIEEAKQIANGIKTPKEKKGFSKTLSDVKHMFGDKKHYKRWLKNKDPKEIEKLKSRELTPEQLEKANQDKELIVDIVKEINIKAEEYSENVESAFDTIGTFSGVIAVPIGIGINKLLKLAKVSPKLRGIISVMVPTFTTLGIIMSSTKQEKIASRIGRYKARQDLLKNPARLIAYSDEEMLEADKIKAPKQKQNFFKKLSGNFKFLGTYFKDKKEYKKYTETTKKQNEKLYKALKQIETTDAQKADAKTLQKNIFTTFDEVDEMSQRYSEDIEAGAGLVMQAVQMIWTIGTTALLSLAVVKLLKGKIPLVKWGNKLVNMTFDKNSSIKKAFNDFNEVMKKQGKSKTQEFQKALVNGRTKKFLAENKEVADAVNPLMREAATLAQPLIKNPKAIEKDAEKFLNEELNKHLKQTPIAKWTRNMISDCGKLKIKSKLAQNDVEIPKETLEKLGLNFTYKNYKTLINTGIVAGVPIFGIIVGVPYAFNAWLANIQKKAGKIGIMQAMDKIDDPRIFAEGE